MLLIGMRKNKRTSERMGDCDYYSESLALATFAPLCREEGGTDGAPVLLSSCSVCW